MIILSRAISYFCESLTSGAKSLLSTIRTLISFHNTFWSNSRSFSNAPIFIFVVFSHFKMVSMLRLLNIVTNFFKIICLKAFNAHIKKRKPKHRRQIYWFVINFGHNLSQSTRTTWWQQRQSDSRYLTTFLKILAVLKYENSSHNSFTSLFRQIFNNRSDHNSSGEQSF